MAIPTNLVRWLMPAGIFAAMRKAKSRVDCWTKRTRTDRVLLRQTADLRLRHAGKRCFIMGSGPSISLQDLSKLRGEFVLSVSNTFVHPEFGSIKPRYHLVPPIAASHGHLYPQIRFVEWFREMETATGDAEMFFHIGDRFWIEQEGLFAARKVHWVDYHGWAGESFDAVDLAALPGIWSVSELALSAAVYMGFERIFFICFRQTCPGISSPYPPEAQTASRTRLWETHPDSALDRRWR